MCIIMDSGIFWLDLELKKFGLMIGCCLRYRVKNSNQMCLVDFVFKGCLNCFSNYILIVYARAKYTLFRPKPLAEAI